MNRTCKTLGRFAAAVATLACSLAVQAADGFKLPDYQKLTLDNGLTIFLMEQHEVPMIDVSVAVKAGAIHDGQEPGSGTTDAGQHGSGHRSTEQI